MEESPQSVAGLVMGEARAAARAEREAAKKAEMEKVRERRSTWGLRLACCAC